MNSDTADLELLLEHRAFVRAVARAVIGDDDLANDVEQDTWIAALRGRSGARSVRGWLAAVARHAAINLMRASRRRSTREAFALADARGDVEPSPDEILAIEDERRRVVTAVMTLDEPLRRTVLLRFFEELPLADVAHRMGEPIDTVRSRLKQAREALRVRLAPKDGDAGRANALAALAGFGTRNTALVATGGVVMGTNALLWSAATCAVVVSAVIWLRIDAKPRGFETAGAPAAAAAASAPAVRAVSDADAAVTRSPEDAATDSKPSRTVTFTGRCITPDNTPLEGARVVVEVGATVPRHVPDDAARTGGDGRFRVTHSASSVPRDYVVLARRADRVDVSQRMNAAPNATIELGDVEMAPAGSIVGRVTDESGHGAGGACVWLVPAPVPNNWASTFDGLEGATTAASTSAAADGSFEFDRVAEEFWVVIAGGPAFFRGHSQPIAVVAGQRGEGDVQVRRGAERKPITLFVRDANGAPIQGARVIDRASVGGRDPVGPDKARFPDANGTVTLDERDGIVHEFSVDLNDGRTARVTGVRGGDPPVELRLPARRSIPLRVTDAVTGALVSVSTFRGSSERGEFDLQWQIAESKQRTVLDFTPPDAEYYVDVWAEGYADKRVGGLPASGPEDGLTIALDPLPRVRGRVLHRGSPVAGASVALQPTSGPFGELVMFDFRSRLGVPCVAAQTDASGSFDVALFPPPTHTVRLVADSTPPDDDGQMLRIEADGLAPAEVGPFTVAQFARAGDLSIEMTEGGALEGVLSVPAGRDPRGIVVAACRGDGVPVTTRTDASGHWRLDHLKAGPWRVETRKDDEFDRIARQSAPPRPADWNAQVRDGATTTVELAVAPDAPCRIEGTFRLDGAVVPAVSARIERWRDLSFLDARGEDLGKRLHDGLRYTPLDLGRVDVHGRWRLGAAEPGVVLLGFRPIGSRDGLVVETPVDLVAGSTHRDVALNTGSLDGQLEPRVCKRVAMFWFGPDNVSAFAVMFTDKDGHFTFEKAPAGAVTVAVMDSGGKCTAPTDVIVTAGTTANVTLRP